MRPEKQQVVHDIRALIEPSPCVFLIAYRGLNAAGFEAFRANLAECGAECHVVPNKLLQRAAAEAGMEALASGELSGDTAMVIGGEDLVAVAKKIREFAKETEFVSIKGGALGATGLDADAVEQLAKMPPREVLLAQLLGVLNAPKQKLVSVLYSATAGIVNLLRSYQHKLEEDAT